MNIIADGLAQVQTGTVAGPIRRGAHLPAADETGHARAARTVAVQGVPVTESAPVIGIAWEGMEAGQRLIWVLVNPR